MQFGVLFLASTCSCVQFQWNRKYLPSTVLKIAWLTVDGSVAWFSICLIRKGKYDWFLLKGLLFDWLIVFLYLLQSVCFSKYSAKTTNFSILNVFLHFLHHFAREHFKIFVTVLRSKFQFLLKFSKRGT